LKRHLVDKELISSLCAELALQPTVFYGWQKEFFENGAAAFQPVLDAFPTDCAGDPPICATCNAERGADNIRLMQPASPARRSHARTYDSCRAADSVAHCPTEELPRVAVQPPVQSDVLRLRK
jgi:hypothetical protein